MKSSLTFCVFATLAATYIGLSSALNTRTAALASSDLVTCKATPTGVRCVAHPIKD